MNTLFNDTGTRRWKNRFLIRIGTRFMPLQANDIALFYTRDRLHWIKTKANADHVIEYTLDELEEQLDPERFFRVNRQFIVSYDAVDMVHALFDGKLRLVVRPAAYEEIIISRLRAGDCKRWLGAGNTSGFDRPSRI
jgi:DNA-binding LytR/AlgR family response regulator